MFYLYYMLPNRLVKAFLNVAGAPSSFAVKADADAAASYESRQHPYAFFVSENAELDNTVDDKPSTFHVARGNLRAVGKLEA